MPTRFRPRQVVTLIGGVAVVGALTAGCAGSSGGSDTTSDQPTDEAAASPHTADTRDMGNMMMNDPGATPASELPGATEAPFVLLETRPPGTDGVQGTAWLARGEHVPGTTLTVRLAGLTPGAEFVGHLHARACVEDNGGPHFKFDQDGSDMPPNEVHIGFTAAADGTGSATVTNERPAHGARSVVIHPSEAMDDRQACADF